VQPQPWSFDVDRAPETALNRVCAYFTMFPLRFPHRILGRAEAGERVLDPFCGRGTTLYAARITGLDSLGIDASPVGAAIAQAKVIHTTPAAVMRAFDSIVEGDTEVGSPQGEFWHWAYAPKTLRTVSRLRAALLNDCTSASRIALRAIVLGALHGPQWKTPTHLSNQAPRTFAPKPRYSVAYWKARDMRPTERDVRALIEARAKRYLALETTTGRGRVILGDSRVIPVESYGKFDWVITSPPYYGMKTYVPDQWIRNWFLGGPAHTDYSVSGQLGHKTPDAFVADLRTVWRRAAQASNSGARLIARFGGINDRSADPLEIIKDSLDGAGWRLTTIKAAGTASTGRRQALAFAATQSDAKAEYDVWAVRV
jgi:hypothetical protein